MGVGNCREALPNADGTLDHTFQPSAAVVGGTVSSVFVQPDGKLILAGDVSLSSGQPAVLVRLNADGSSDPAFHYAGSELPARLTLEADGRILLSFSQDPAGSRLVRVHADGSADPTSQATTNSDVYALATRADGAVYVGGLFNEVNGTGCASLVRLLADGSLDAGYKVDANSGPNSQVDCLAVQTGGKILVGGEFTSVSGVTRRGIARLNSDGSPDAAFSANIAVAGALPAVHATDALGSGKILIAGHFDQVNGEARRGLAHLSANGGLSPFVPMESGVGPNGYVTTFLQQADGKVLLGGYFTSVNGVSRNFVARLQENGRPDFFNWGVSVGGGFYYEQFPDGTPFGYYNLPGNGYSFPYFFHADLGMEYFFDAQDKQGGAYLYDFASGTFFYTAPPSLGLTCTTSA